MSVSVLGSVEDPVVWSCECLGEVNFSHLGDKVVGVAHNLSGTKIRALLVFIQSARQHVLYIFPLIFNRDKKKEIPFVI